MIVAFSSGSWGLKPRRPQLALAIAIPVEPSSKKPARNEHLAGFLNETKPIGWSKSISGSAGQEIPPI
jgi:hypothetical protein